MSPFFIISFVLVALVFSIFYKKILGLKQIEIKLKF